MQYCTACQKAIATIVIMDLSEGSVTGSQHVCAECAEQLGVTPPKQPKFSTEILEDLLGGLSAGLSVGPSAGLPDSDLPGGGLPIAGEPFEGQSGSSQLPSGLSGGRHREGPRSECCPGCGMIPADFRAKGRLGCPRCYDAFRHELMPLLQRIHESQSHTGRLPSTTAQDPEPSEERDLSELRQKLEDAVRGERYEEAARLRDSLRRAERGEPHDGDGC